MKCPVAEEFLYDGCFAGDRAGENEIVAGAVIYFKAPVTRTRGPRCAPRRSFHSLLRCLLRPPSSS
jgi:hypothetical protein